MSPLHATFAREFLKRKLEAMRLWVSSLNDPQEKDAYGALANPLIVAEIIDYAMERMGYVPKNHVQGLRPADDPRGSRRVRALRRSMAGPRGERAETEETETV